MKATLKLNLKFPSHKKELNRCLNSLNAYLALMEIGDKIFRPARKHGYMDRELNELIGLVDHTDTEAEKAALAQLALLEEQNKDKPLRLEAMRDLSQKIWEAKYNEENEAVDAISLLEKKYYEILEEYSIDFNDVE